MVVQIFQSVPKSWINCQSFLNIYLTQPFHPGTHFCSKVTETAKKKRRRPNPNQSEARCFCSRRDKGHSRFRREQTVLLAVLKSTSLKPRRHRGRCQMKTNAIVRCHDTCAVVGSSGCTGSVVVLGEHVSQRTGLSLQRWGRGGRDVLQKEQNDNVCMLSISTAA